MNEEPQKIDDKGLDFTVDSIQPDNENSDVNSFLNKEAIVSNQDIAGSTISTGLMEPENKINGAFAVSKNKKDFLRILFYFIFFLSVAANAALGYFAYDNNKTIKGQKSIIDQDTNCPEAVTCPVAVENEAAPVAEVTATSDATSTTTTTKKSTTRNSSTTSVVQPTVETEEVVSPPPAPVD